MTRQEFEALIQIVMRAPLSQAEALWFTALMQRERARLARQQVEEEADKP